MEQDEHYVFNNDRFTCFPRTLIPPLSLFPYGRIYEKTDRIRIEGAESPRKQVDKNPTVPRKQTCTEIGRRVPSNLDRVHAVRAVGVCVSVTCPILQASLKRHSVRNNDDTLSRASIAIYRHGGRTVVRVDLDRRKACFRRPVSRDNFTRPCN